MKPCVQVANDEANEDRIEDDFYPVLGQYVNGTNCHQQVAKSNFILC